MTVSELLNQLKDCAPGATVAKHCFGSDGEPYFPDIRAVKSDGETVVLY